MSKIDELIDELCPDGVHFIELKSLVSVANRGVDKIFKDGEKEVKLLNYMDIARNRYINTFVLTASTSASVKQIIDCDIKKGDVFITPSSETKDDLAHASVITEDIKNAVYSYHIMRLRKHKDVNLNSSYLAYLFRSDQIQSQIAIKTTGMTRFGLTKLYPQ